MRKVVEVGEKFSKFGCPFCGQVELLTDGEEPICQNCGSAMEVIDETVNEPVEDIEPQSPEPSVDGEPSIEELRIL